MSDPRFMKEDDDILVRLQKDIVEAKVRSEAADKALSVAHDNFKIYAENINKRLDAANHFKEIMQTQSGSYVTKEKFELAVGFQNRVIGVGLSLSIGIPIALTFISILIKKG